MNIVLDLARHVKVYYVLDVREIQTLGCNIGSYQDILPTSLAGARSQSQTSTKGGIRTQKRRKSPAVP